MKIKSINCKHTVSCREIAVYFDETINNDIINRFNNTHIGIYLSRIQNEESVFTIKVDKPNSIDRNIVVEKDIKFINEELPKIKAEIEKEEADRKAKRKQEIETASKNTGLPLDCNNEE